MNHSLSSERWLLRNMGGVLDGKRGGTRAGGEDRTKRRRRTCPTDDPIHFGIEP